MVATANAQLLDIARFCTHHLNEGAVTIDMHFDDPKRNVIEALHSLPKLGYFQQTSITAATRGKPPKISNSVNTAMRETLTDA